MVQVALSEASFPNNLPLQVTSFIGREKEIAEVNRLLAGTRLLTMTGPGGCGKTRLALQTVGSLHADYPDGIWMVEFAPLSEPTLVTHAAASALGVVEQPGRPLIETLAEYLRSKVLLVVLDNCEHLGSAPAQMADTLLRGCRDLRILATSRETLRIAGEVQYFVRPLSVPDPQHVSSIEDLTQYEAVRLFVERAVAVQPIFRATTENSRAIARLCHQLDGIPLAIELAAARVKVLAVAQIADRLDDRFALLTGGSRTAGHRHQTLRAAMDWSYDLLSEKEQALLRRLSVFAGGCTIEVVEAVCAGGALKTSEMLNLLTQLVDKSLIQVEIHEAEARYTMLETVRQYGRGRLEETGETAELRQRHCNWYVALAERTEPELRGPNQIAWLERLEKDRDNLRAALEWSRTEVGASVAGLRLTAALRDFWDIRGPLAEGSAWLKMLLVHKGAGPGLRVKALNCAGHLAHRQGDYAQVPAVCGEALALSQSEGDKKGMAEALHHLAHVAESAGDHARAAELLEQSVVLHRAAENTLGLATSLNCLANTTRLAANYRKAEGLFEEALALFQQLGDKRGRATVLHNLGYVALRQGDHRRSQALFREGLTLTEELRDRRVINCLTGLAGASAESKPDWAARLFGAASVLMSAVGARLEPVNRPDYDHYVTIARNRLGERAFSTAWTRGAGMTLDQAMEYALAAEDAATPPDAKVNKLSPREREVTSLVAQGLTNREIASRLIIAERTVDAHVEHILNKLGFNSRTQIAAWAVEQGLHRSHPD